MITRFFNTCLITMVDDTIINDGELFVDGDKIVYCGNSSDAPDNISVNREIDCNGDVLMPGFKNTHTHSAMTALRSYADDMPLADWLNKQVFPFESHLTGDDVYWFSALAILEYLTSGITAVSDMYIDAAFYTSRAFADMGMRNTQVGALNNNVSSVAHLKEYYNKINNIDPYNKFCIGFHAEYTVSSNLLEEIARFAHDTKSPVCTHNSETIGEVEDSKNRNGGLTPTAYLDSFGMFEYGGTCYHCVYIDDNDIEIFRRRGINIVTCPASNLKLASGIAPVEKFRQAHLNIAIGTDGAASNNCLDMFREMFLVTALAKYRENDAAVIDAADVLKMATVNGAEALQLEKCKTLAVGNYADIIRIDLQQPNMQPLNNIVKNIVYSGSKSNIKMTMINGRILYENGTFFTSLQPDEIYYRTNDAVKRIVG